MSITTEQILTRKQACTRLNIHRDTFRRWVTVGLQGRRLRAWQSGKGGHWLTSVEAIEEFMEVDQSPPTTGHIEQISSALEAQFNV